MAFASAPITVTPTGETLRAVAYASSPRPRGPLSIPMWIRIAAFIQVVRIPILLVLLTAAWVRARVRGDDLEATPA